ncbi:hypothetical protein V6N12_065940 [Hibiscus sabdariffa]
MDTSSKKTDTRVDGSSWKEKRRNSLAVSSSSESQSPMTGGSKCFRGVDVAINANDGNTHINHGKEVIDLGKTRCQENRGEVGEGVETLAAVSIKSKQLHEGLKDANQSKPIMNWAEFLFKNKEAVEGQTYKRSPGKSGFKETIDLEEGDFGNLNLGLDLNAGKDSIGVDGPTKIVEELGVNSPGEKRSPRLYRGISINDRHCEALGEVERPLGEDECESPSESDGELNCDKVERVFFPEIVSKKSTKKRFGSLKQFQDSSISVKDQKRRDKAAKKENQFNSTAEASELSGRSLSDSDLVFHNEILTKKAKEALALGKRLGVEIEGNEDGALEELVRLESQN